MLKSSTTATSVKTKQSMNLPHTVSTYFNLFQERNRGNRRCTDSV